MELETVHKKYRLSAFLCGLTVYPVIILGFLLFLVDALNHCPPFHGWVNSLWGGTLSLVGVVCLPLLVSFAAVYQECSSYRLLSLSAMIAALSLLAVSPLLPFSLSVHLAGLLILVCVSLGCLLASVLTLPIESLLSDNIGGGIFTLRHLFGVIFSFLLCVLLYHLAFSRLGSLIALQSMSLIPLLLFCVLCAHRRHLLTFVADRRIVTTLSHRLDGSMKLVFFLVVFFASPACLLFMLFSMRLDHYVVTHVHGFWLPTASFILALILLLPMRKQDFRAFLPVCTVMMVLFSVLLGAQGRFEALVNCVLALLGGFSVGLFVLFLRDFFSTQTAFANKQSALLLLVAFVMGVALIGGLVMLFPGVSLTYWCTACLFLALFVSYILACPEKTD